MEKTEKEKVTASCTDASALTNATKGEDGIWIVKVNNSTGVVLPLTGGPGTLTYTLGGFILMISALMYGFMMRRRERRLM